MSREPIKKRKNAGHYLGAHAEMLKAQDTSPAPAATLPELDTYSTQAYGNLLDLEDVLGTEGDCYVKITPDGTGKAFHCFAYFKDGRWAGYYVYAVGFRCDLSGGLAILARRITEVRAGDRTPTRDRRKGPGWTPLD